MARIRAGPSSSQSHARGHKRRASTASIDNQVNESVEGTVPQSSSGNHGPRRSKKRVKHASVGPAEALEDLNPVREASEGNDHIVVDGRVGFSEPPAEMIARTTTTQTIITPARPTRAQRPAPSRSLSDRTGNEKSYQELQFSPLRSVLDGRTRRRLRRSHMSEEVNEIEEQKREDAKRKQELKQLRHLIRQKEEREQELINALEAQRQLGIDAAGYRDQRDEQFQALEDEIRRLRAEIQQHQEDQERQIDALTSDGVQADYADVDSVSDDDDGLVLVRPEDIPIPMETTITGPNTDKYRVNDGHTSISVIPGYSEATTQVSLPDRDHETEIFQFQETVRRLHSDLAASKSAVDIMTVELRSLGFSHGDADPEVILQHLRAVFRDSRLEIEDLLPGAMPTDLPNKEVLPFLLSHVRGLIQTRDEQLKTIEEYIRTQNVLVDQHKGLVIKLEEFAHNKAELDEKFSNLDKDSDEKSKYIVDLEEELEEVKGNLQGREEELAQVQEQLEAFRTESTDLHESHDRLKTAIQGYREEVSSLEALIERTEKEHANAIAEMEQKHSAETAELQKQLDTERYHRELAEADIDEKTKFTTELELKIEKVESALDDYREQLSALTTTNEAEKRQRKAAEEELEDREEAIADYRDQISDLEAELAELREELETVAVERDEEQARKEKLEETVEEQEDKIAQLEHQINENGDVANELRQKIFGLQQSMRAVEEELADKAAEREEQYQMDMSEEIERREEAESLAAARAGEIAVLEEQLAALEENIQAVEAEKAQAIAERDAKIADYEYTLQGNTEDLEELRLRRQELEAHLQEEMQKAHDAEIAHEQETQELRESVVERENQIAKWQSDYNQTVNELNDTIKAKTEEIYGLQVIADTRAAKMAELSTSLEHLKEEFRQYVQYTEETINSLQAEVRTAYDRNEARSQAFLKRSRSSLSAVENATVEGVRVAHEHVTINGLKTPRGSQPASQRRLGTLSPITSIARRFGFSRAPNKRQYDSGIGVEEGDMTDADSDMLEGESVRMVSQGA